jgi:hypothetical protein
LGTAAGCLGARMGFSRTGHRGQRHRIDQGKRGGKRDSFDPPANASASMARRGSTVGVRQRALQKRRKAALSLSDGLASHATCGRYGTLWSLQVEQTPSEELRFVVFADRYGRQSGGTGRRLLHLARRDSVTVSGPPRMRASCRSPRARGCGSARRIAGSYAPTLEQTDWPQIVSLYDRLLAVAPRRSLPSTAPSRSARFGAGGSARSG